MSPAMLRELASVAWHDALAAGNEEAVHLFAISDTLEQAADDAEEREERAA